MVTSLSLSILYTRAGAGAGSSVLDSAPAAKTAPAPKAPAGQPAQLPGSGKIEQGSNPNEVKIDLSQQAPAAPADAKKQQAPAKK
jgi:hypothetical protein